jgi:hypothetical protein
MFRLPCTGWVLLAVVLGLGPGSPVPVGASTNEVVGEVVGRGSPC